LIDTRLARCFGDANEEAVVQVLVIAFQRNAAHNSSFEQPAIDLCRCDRRANNKLVEESSAKFQVVAVQLRNLRRGIMCLMKILSSYFLYSALAHRREINGGHQCKQTLVRADIRRSLLSTNVLLTSRKRQHVTSPALRIEGFTNQTARHLSYVLVSRSKQTAVRAAKA